MKFKFLILEQDGSIDEEVKEYSDAIAGLEHAVRFIKLFEHDKYKRIARVMADDKVIVTHDSGRDVTYFGRPASVQQR